MRGGMMKDKIPMMARFVLIALCGCVAIVCILKMNQSYDPLARYPYVDAENRDVILEYLNDDDIDYIITQKIKPEQFMDFIDLPDFKIHNTLFYSSAKKIQDEENTYIVNFINKYREYFSLDACKELLKHYSYADLTSFYETQQNQVKLVLNPSNPYTILDEDHSVYKYVPDHLVEYENILVCQEIVNDLKEMQNDYSAMMNYTDSLTFISGYSSYEEITNGYVHLQSRLQGYVDNFYLPAGHNELQLGYTIILDESQDWNSLCVQEETYNHFDYQNVYAQLTPEFINKMNWIKNNAHQYGFIVRYPEGKEEKTGQEYQPFVLRYVGVDTAKEMFESGKILEEMKNLKELGSR